MSYIYEIEVQIGDMVKRYKAYRMRILSWGKLAFVPVGASKDEECILKWDSIRVTRVPREEEKLILWGRAHQGAVYGSGKRRAILWQR